MKAFHWILTFAVIIQLLFLAGTPVSVGATNQEVEPKIVTSFYPQHSPILDGVISSGEWEDSTRIVLDKATLFVLHDAAMLYLLLDVTPDTINSTMDYANFTIDTNRDGAITPNVDLHYGETSSHAPCRQYYLGADAWSLCMGTGELFKSGFGPSPVSGISHRYYEVGIPLVEISAQPGSEVHLGLRVHSDNPLIDFASPVNVSSDFSNLHKIYLSNPTVRLLILADQDDQEALLPLKEHKDWSGMPTYIQSWQNLAQAYKLYGLDVPEQIKRGIAHYDKISGADYVMLVGDADTFPMRYTLTDRGTAEAYNTAFYSGDLYYADLYEADHNTIETWDADQDGYYGELYGETHSGTVNIDQVDLVPDIAVGRVPANTTVEISNYVQKVITYELNAYKAGWANQALAVTTEDWMNDYCQDTETILSSFLNGYGATRLYRPTTGTTCPTTNPPSSTNINNAINLGTGFTMYMGHGADYGWQIPTDEYRYEDLPGLTNTSMPTIMFGMACSTAHYTTDPPYAPYTDVNGTHHIGTNSGEVFTAIPPQPAFLQVVDNPRSFAEAVLVESLQGAVAYVGGVTGSQPVGRDLIKSFFEGRKMGALTVGQMWNYMVNRYYQLHPIPASIASPDWYVVATAHQPWKFHLMGDPSLRIYGVSYIEKADFVGSYTMNHDGWEGELWLGALTDDPVEGSPNIGGLYFSSGGAIHTVRGYVRTWEYPIGDSTWPDHKIRFYINFNDTSDPADDQMFEGYLFTHNKDLMAGVTYWNDIPFGFHAEKTTGTAKSVTASGASETLVYNKSVFLGKYWINYDGWQATLVLLAKPDTAGQPNIGGFLIFPEGDVFQVNGFVRTATYPIDPAWGPDHRIEFYVDFNNTPASSLDDQMFEGLLYTHGQKWISGITWWNNIPFGFQAQKASDIYLPLIRR